MSIKNHTKNELARITSKIQQLKKKYPVSQELYISQERQSQMLGDNALQEINLHGNNESHMNQRILRPKSISQVSKAHRNQDPTGINYNVSNSIEFSYRNDQNQNSVNINQPASKTYQSPQSHPQSVTSTESLQINFMKQKHFKQYKEELKNLKKQILSGLDFSNFPLKKHNQTQYPIALREQQLVFNKTSQTIQKIQPNVNKKQYHDQPKLSQVEQYKNRLLQNRSKKQVKSITSIESSEYSEMKELIKKLSLEIQNQKNSFEQRLSKLEFQSNYFTDQNQEAMNQIQIIEKTVHESLRVSKLSEYDLKVVQIQNQSISKLSKDIHKEIQSMQIDLKDVKQTLLRSVKNDPSIDKNEVKEIVMQYMQKRIGQEREIGQHEMKQVQVKFYRQIFELKNEIGLLNEKLKKQDYIERTIKQLIPPKGRSIEQQIPKILQRVKSQLSQDNGFLTSILNFIDEKLPQSHLHTITLDQLNGRFRALEQFVENRVSQSYKIAKKQIEGFVAHQLGYFSTYLKEFSTKMTSYGILIQHLEQSLKELAMDIHQESEVQSQIHGFIKQQKAEQQIQNNEVEAYRNQQAIGVEDMNKKPQDEFFITKMGDSKLNESINCQKGFLLDDLIKNSLVFSAMND